MFSFLLRLICGSGMKSRGFMTEKEFIEAIYPLRDRMFRFAFVLLGQKEQAEDVVQNVMVKMWTWKWLRTKPKNIDAFVMSSVKNACFDVLRRRKFLSEEEVPERMEVPPDAPLWDQKRIVRTALLHISEKQRLCVMLKDMEGCDTEEVAEIMGMSVENVRMTLSRGRKELKEQINRIIKWKSEN